jgi:hypothetical protein
MMEPSVAFAERALVPAPSTIGDVGQQLTLPGVIAPHGATLVAESEYANVQVLFDWLNSRLFDGRLPQSLLLLYHHEHELGRFVVRRSRGKGGIPSERYEISLNVDLHKRGERDLASTLLHEMVHLETHLAGKVESRRCHSKGWAERMVRVGLCPTHTGRPGGRQTGQSMTHLIVEGGAFDKAWKALVATGWRLRGSPPAGARRFVCARCGQAATGEPRARLMCGACLAQALPRAIGALRLSHKQVETMMAPVRSCAMLAVGGAA